MIYIFDLDGTVRNLNHRLHFIQNGKKDWRGFFKACKDDEPIQDVIALAYSLKDAGHEIVIISGCSDEVWLETVEWLEKHFPTYQSIFMRKHGDNRHDYIVKSELLDEAMNCGFTKEMIAGVFEDRDQVVKMYRDRGLRVYQVSEGSF